MTEPRHKPYYSTTRQGGPHSRLLAAIRSAGQWLGPLKSAHALLTISGLDHSLRLLTRLATSACIAGSPSYAGLILIRLVPRADAYLFESLIWASARSGSPLSGFLFYRAMLLSPFCHLPSSFTFTSLLKSCSDLSAASHGRLLHAHYILGGRPAAGDPFTPAGLITFYSRSGCPLLARKVFDRMPHRTLVAWNSMIAGYEQNAMPAHALSVFSLMRASSAPADDTTVVGVAAACAQMGEPGPGRAAHGWAEVAGLRGGVQVETALLTMYCRCGEVGPAEAVFSSMKDRNAVAWTAMISGYGAHGLGREAVGTFRRMKAEDGAAVPNAVTFVAVLSACAHAGMVAEGKEVMACMQAEYGLAPSPEHHVCMVDLLGRAGLLSEAMDYIKEVGPGGAGGAAWTAMLAACKMHKNIEMGAEAAGRLLELEPGVPAHYVHVSNVYASAGRMDRVEAVRDRMGRRGLRKCVGFSTVRVGGRTHFFGNGDRWHEDTAEIYAYLEGVIRRCKEAGYVPCHGSAMHQLEDEEVAEYALMYHSEKLAVAYGLLRARYGESVIRVVKNLRMCEDCHSALKFISAVQRRQILVRDKLRFHHFQHGSCSCRDYW